MLVSESSKVRQLMDLTSVKFSPKGVTVGIPGPYCLPLYHKLGNSERSYQEDEGLFKTHLEGDTADSPSPRVSGGAKGFSKRKGYKDELRREAHVLSGVFSGLGSSETLAAAAHFDLLE